MFLQVSLLALAVFQVANSAALRDDKIDPVDLNYYCMTILHGNDDEDKSPVLLIHGLTSSHASWLGVQQVLAYRTRRRVCAIDLRNHGESPWSNRTDVEAMAVDIDHFLDTKNIKNVNLIGHSLGGKTAIHYALKHPERVDSLVVEDMRPNSVAPQGLKLVQTIVQYFREATKSISEVSTEDEARKVLIDFFNKKLDEMGVNQEIDEEGINHLAIRCKDGKCEFKMNPYLLDKFAEDPASILIESKGLYEGPTLFIYGKVSPFHVNEDEENILKLFPNAKLIGVEGAGHTIHGKHKEFEDEVIKLLNK